MFKSVLVAAVFLFSAQTVSAATFFVSKNGNGSNPQGSFSTGWNELNQIVWSQISPGDTILIDGGATACPAIGTAPNCGMVYSTPLSIGKSGTSANPITIRLGSAGTAIIDGGINPNTVTQCSEYLAASDRGNLPYIVGATSNRETGISFSSHQWIILDGTKWGGVEIRNHTRYGVNFSSSQNNIARYLKIHHNTTPGDNANGAVGVTQNYESRNNVLSRSEIFRNGQDAVRGAGDNFVMEENYIHDHYCNHPDGIQAFIPTNNGDVPDNEGLINNLIIRRNIFDRVGLQPIFLGENDSHDSWVENVTIENNLLIQGRDMIKTKSGKTRNVTVRNNTLYRSTGWAIEWCCDDPGAISPMVVTNNIFYITPDGSRSDRQSSFGFSNAPTTFSNNCLYQPRGRIPDGNGNLTVDPLFVSPSTGNYALSSNSPCAGRGANITSVSQLIGLSSTPTSPTPTLPSPPNSFVLEAETATISSPFAITGNYISQPSLTALNNSGRAAFNVNVVQPGRYFIRGNVDAATLGSNSFFINLNSEPTEQMIWHIDPLTAGFENRLYDQVFTLSPGQNTVIVRGREGNTRLDRIELIQLRRNGDLIQDAKTDIYDLNLIISEFGISNIGDLDYDGQTSFTDYNFMRQILDD